MILAVAAGAAGYWALRQIQLPYQGYADEVELEVRSGTDAGSILDDLERRGVLRDAFLTRVYLVYVLGSPSLQAGEYRFAGPLAAPQVLERLIRGEIVTHPVTLVEGLDLEESARLLAEQGFGALETFRREMASPARIADLDPAATDLEGYLFPDTYRFARGTDERQVVDTLVSTFRRRLEAEVPAADPGLPASGLRALVTLASIVEKEAALDSERATIAGVYANRLRRGIALQADPTVIFALKRAGTWNGNLRRPDLKFDSPYNTYRYPGLPPGPICSPGVASLRAAAQPAESSYLYFVSRNDGSHAFSSTLAEHNRNVEQWQRRYWRERWARERAAKTPDGD